MRYQARLHPTLDILCDSMGRVFVPQNGPNKAHWTFGSLDSKGYRHVQIDGKGYSVARLICEAFHGLAPKDRPTCDHIDRNRDWNVPENLRWLDMHGQNNNRQVCIDSLNKYDVRECEDPNGYHRSLRAKNLEYAERERAYQRGRYANDPEYAEHKRARRRERYAKQKALRLAAKEN